VTTLIKKYVPEFDAHYWSTYKAMKAVLERKGEWRTYKENCGGWENVVAYVRLDKKFKYREEVMAKKREILAMWEEEKNAAATRGTIYHKKREADDRKSGVVVHEAKEHYVMSSEASKSGIKEDGLYPELLIYDDEFEIAGQADWVLKAGSTIHIKDYKTSKDVDKAGFMDEMLLYPLNGLLNAKFYIYSIQMSLYAYLLERKGYDVGTLVIEHVDGRTHETLDKLPTEYYRNEVIALIKDWRETKKKKAV
jgi:hypothetical protein